MSDTYLHLIQIGPVQSFIAAARRTQDLFVGSRLLSMIASAGVRAAQQADPAAELLFPAPDNSGPLPTSVPHRFAFLSAQAPTAVASAVEQAVAKCWKHDIAGKVRGWLQGQVGSGDWMTIFDRQVESWLEVYSVAVRYDDQKHGACYQAAVQAMSARKQARHFPQVDEPGRKCTLTGAQSALSDRDEFWQRLRNAPDIRPYQVDESNTDNKVLRSNERLGALAVIKRFAVMAGVVTQDDPGFPSTEHIAGWMKDTPPDRPLYLAVLHMDGDRMGKLLGEKKTKEEHRELSQKLAEFARESVPEIVGANDLKDKGRSALIYAGGDDVLALLPLQTVLACAAEIQERFKQHIGGTMSAGIAITSASMPLDIGLDEARHAEKHAKEGYGRNAVVVRDIRSNAIRETGAQWSTEIIGLVEELQKSFQAGWLSGKIGYELLEVASALQGEAMADARIAEAKRLLKRHSEKAKEGARDELAKKLVGALGQLKMADVAQWVVLSRFLAKGGQP